MNVLSGILNESHYLIGSQTAISRCERLIISHNLLIFRVTIRDNDTIMKDLSDKSVDLISKIERLAVCLDAHNSEETSESMRRCASNRPKTLANWHSWAIDRYLLNWL
jgi:hypothetical protein